MRDFSPFREQLRTDRVPERVVLAQLSHPLNDRNPWFCNKENVPLAAGYLRAVARSRGLFDKLSLEILEPDLVDRAGDAALAAALAERAPDILGLSLYPWNYTRSLSLAETLREKLPGLLVVAGGPEVNPVTLAGLLGEGLVDIGVPGEGEITFSCLLEALLEETDLSQVEGLVFKNNGSLIKTTRRPTLSDLDRIPSPYLEGDIDARHYRQVHVLYERGCPNKCTFCHWWPDRASQGRFSLARIEKELVHLRECGVEEVVFLDAALNTCHRFDDLCELLERVNGDHKFEIKVQLLFDTLDRTQLERLVRGGVQRLELGLQSADPEVLQAVNRPADPTLFTRALELTEGLPLDLQIDFMMGMPGQTLDSIESTARFVGELATRHRVTQASPFVLSVGTPTRLRAEARALGMRYQPEPPHRVLTTEDLDYGSLRSLRRRLPELLGTPQHPYFDYDRAHYGVNLFEPELALDSGPQAAARGWPVGHEEPAADSGRVDALHLSCSASGEGHGHGFSAETFASRLSQLVQVWFRVEHPECCVEHMAADLGALSGPNPFAVWDLVLETPRAFDPDVMGTLVGALKYRVNNLDWDSYLVNRRQESGHARVATRPFVIVPLDAVTTDWVTRAATRFPLVFAITVAQQADVKQSFQRVAELPGEGVLLECAPEADSTTVLAACTELMALDRRVRVCRNLALKALVAVEEARRLGKPRPRIPYHDRTLAFVEADGHWTTRTVSRRRTLMDLTQLGWSLSSAATQAPGT